MQNGNLVFSFPLDEEVLDIKQRFAGSLQLNLLNTVHLKFTEG